MEELVSLPQKSFWRGKRVLITGHSGFKGSWLTLWLHRLGANVVGVGLPPHTAPNLFSLAGIQKVCQSHFCDIRHASELATLIHVSRPEIIFHLAAKSLVRTSYSEPQETFDTNIMGTVHVLDALRGLGSVKVAIVVTSDKVYSNLEQLKPYTEDSLLGGHDPYSASKAASEIVTCSYRDAFLRDQGVAIATARAGNVIGGGDWSNDRLIPDAIRAWQAAQVLYIRSPEAIRPWQHVLDPLAGYLSLAERLWENPMLMGAYNFGPEVYASVSVKDVVEWAKATFGMGQVSYQEGNEGPHEAGLLVLDTEKARITLGVEPRWALSEAVEYCIEWYRAQQGGVDARELCLADIAAFEGKP